MTWYWRLLLFAVGFTLFIAAYALSVDKSRPWSQTVIALLIFSVGLICWFAAADDFSGGRA